MTDDFLTTIKFMMDGYAYQIMKNQRDIMRHMIGDWSEDTRRSLRQRVSETESVINRLEQQQSGVPQ